MTDKFTRQNFNKTHESLVGSFLRFRWFHMEWPFYNSRQVLVIFLKILQRNSFKNILKKYFSHKFSFYWIGSESAKPLKFFCLCFLTLKGKTLFFFPKHTLPSFENCLILSTSHLVRPLGETLNFLLFCCFGLCLVSWCMSVKVIFT